MYIIKTCIYLKYIYIKIALGMNSDNINDENVPFDRAISDTMIILANYLKDPIAVKC